MIKGSSVQIKFQFRSCEKRRWCNRGVIIRGKEVQRSNHKDGGEAADLWLERRRCS